MKKKKIRKSYRVSLEQTADSVIVHDMKNLAFRLSALLQNMDVNYDNPVFKQSMSEILSDTIGQMETIVKRFRDNQQQVVVKLRVDLNQIISDLIKSLPSRKTRNLQFDIQLGNLPSIWADQFYLHNAFQSIVNNSLEATPDGGVISVRTMTIQHRKKQKVCVEISDTGVGMDQDFMENRLFKPFTSSKEKGLGLGLFTCQQIIALHRGTIDVESAPGEGATFRILLPAEEYAG